MTRSAADIRQEFIDFFAERGHAFVPGSPVVPYDDPTLLFTNAGMNQFKDVFLATGTRNYTRAANSQPCIRAGGKHNDLDDVGQDTYHHTFFEMLGNWSFGDYFKKEAIEWAWELLTKVWGLDKTRLHATYLQGDESEGLQADLEAKELWAAVTDIDPTHIHPGSKKDNFWEMGDVGPCGPCSEIHIDLTPDKSGISLVNAGDARVIEIWNLVFIQFSASWLPGGQDAMTAFEKIKVPTNSTLDANEARRRLRIEQYGTADRGIFLARNRKLEPLPAKHVDTGMGFERVCALLQGKSSNYDTDVFTPIFQAIREITGAPPYRGTLPEEPRTSVRPEPAAPEEPRTSVRPEFDAPDAPRGLKPAAPRDAALDQHQLMTDISYRVIADHARCLTFAINDGCIPDRGDRGAVLRRIVRRAARYAWQYLNMHEPFLYKLVPAVVATLGDAFPQLKQKPEQITEIIREEEESFDRTLDRGIALFEEASLWAFARELARTSDKKLVTITGPWPEGTPGAGTRYIQLAGMQSGIPVTGGRLTHELMKAYISTTPVISGEDAFKLHATYGFPIDLTQMMAEEKGLTVDTDEFDRLMDEEREKGRGAEREVSRSILDEWHPQAVPACDESPKYGISLSCRATVMMIHSHLQDIVEGTEVVVMTDRTCFYAEQGGQVSDTGTLSTETGEIRITSVGRALGSVAHVGVVTKGTIKEQQSCELRVDPRRSSTMQNHTATHVMNWALREVLGDHVQQKGSLVDPDKTRFDFSHSKAMTPEEIERVESLVNERIAQNLTVYDEPVEQEQALKIHGLRAVFGEKYPDVVRVMSIGTPVSELVANPDNPEWRNVSIEFCGGTHCQNTGQIGHFAIVSEEAVAKGIRRVVGITGEAAQAAIDRGAELLRQADDLRRVGTAHQNVAAHASRSRPHVAAGGSPAESPGDAPTPQPRAAVPHAETDLATQFAELQQTIADETLRVVDRAKLRAAIAELQRIIRKQQKREAAAVQDVVTDRINQLFADAPKLGDTTLIVAEMPDVPIDQLKTGADMIKQKCGSAAVLFGVKGESKALLLAAMSNDLVNRGIKAGDLIKHVAPIVDGRGGGPPTMAQAGGKDPGKIPETLEAGRKWIEQKLG